MWRTDADVEPANDLVQSNYPPSPNAVIFMKVKSYFLADTLESHLQKVTKKIHGFVVSESVILDDTEKSPLGSRSEGFSQVVFLSCRLEYIGLPSFEHHLPFYQTVLSRYLLNLQLPY